MNLYMLFRFREPLYQYGLFTEAAAEKISNLLSGGDYEMRVVVPKTKPPEIHRFEAKVNAATRAVESVETIKPHPASSISWQTGDRKYAYGRGFTEEEAIANANRNLDEEDEEDE